jgi:two-component system, cell cycle sensor histidine kinase and response regulator CckA
MDSNSNRYRLSQFTIDKTAFSIFWIRPDATFHEVNEAACRTLGYDREELLKLTVSDIDPHVSREMWGHLMSALREKQTDKILSEHRDRNGRLFPVEIVANYAEFDGQEFICTFVRDITERVEAEKALQQSEARFRALVEHASEAIVVYDLESERFVDFNENACQLFKLDRESLLRMNLVSLSPEFQADGRRSTDLAREMLRRAEAGESPRFEWQHRNSLGDLFPCETNLTRLPSLKGVLIRGSITDVTHRRRIEAELQKSQRLESLGILAGGIAHDFNNLIGVLYGSIDLAHHMSREMPVKRHLNEALQSIDRARGLTQQLLTFARGGQPIKKLNALPHFIKETVRFALSGSAVECRFDIPENTWICEIDRNQIGQVIDNLVINAKQAMADGGSLDIQVANVVIDSEIKAALVPGPYVRIAIRDHGPGIPADLQSRIFDPFFTTKPNGQGLGLSTTFSIIHRHRGLIEVESTRGQGSTFTFHLPALPEARLAQGLEKPQAFAGQGIFLVMDDDAAMRQTMSAMLESLGYEALSAASGEETLRLFSELTAKNIPVAGMLFDLTVPGKMGGREAIVEVRKRNKDVPAYVASGYAEEDVMARPQAYGFTASIRKPFLKSDLISMLQSRS